MVSSSAQPEVRAPRVEILESSVDYAFRDRFRVVRARLQYRRFDGTMSRPITRISFERGDSVGVLLYDTREDMVILVRQFRYPVYAGLNHGRSPDDAAQEAWLLEVVAGIQEEGETVRDIAHRELLEEAGYRTEGELEHIATFYASPGGTSERIHLYLGYVNGQSRSGAGGGLIAEGEDTQVVVLPLAEAMAQVSRGEIQDAKTIVALQHLALLKAGADGASVARFTR